MPDDFRSQPRVQDSPDTVEVLTRLAKRHVTTAQLVDLIGHLELELIARSTDPIDDVMDERPR